MSGDYRRGWRDREATYRAQDAALKGPDRNRYELIGGPRAGDLIETGGRHTFVVALPSPPPSVADFSYYADLGRALAMRTGEYRREEIAGPGSVRRTVYVWQGER